MTKQSYFTMQALKYHVFRIHDTVRRFGCDQCDKTFKAPVELSHHKKRIHDKSTPIQCDLCGTVLSSKDYLVIQRFHQHFTFFSFLSDFGKFLKNHLAWQLISKGIWNRRLDGPSRDRVKVSQKSFVPEMLDY